MRTRPTPRGWLWHVLWFLPLVLIEAILVFGLLAEDGYHDYTKTYSLFEAVENASKVPLSNALSKLGIAFVPLTLIAFIVAEWRVRKTRSRRSVVAIGLMRL